MALFCATATTDVLRACDSEAQSGLEQKVVLIPTSANPTITLDNTNPNELITLITATGGVAIEGVLEKFWINENTSFQNPDDGLAGFIHAVEGIRIMTNSVASRKFVNDLKGGNTYYAVIQARWKGASKAAAFRVLGYEWGLSVPDGGIIENSNENDGSILVTLQTPSGLREGFLPRVYLETDYATSLAAFNNKFVTGG